MLTIREFAFGIGVAAGDVGMQYLDKKSTPVPVEFMKTKSDIYRAAVFGVPLVLGYFMPKYARLCDDVARSALPLLAERVGRKIVNEMQTEVVLSQPGRATADAAGRWLARQRAGYKGPAGGGIGAHVAWKPMAVTSGGG
jgi:hypothetical protein